MVRTHDRAAVNIAWFVRNVAKLLAVLVVGFILASASNPDTLPDDLGRAINTLLGNALFSLVFIGAVVMVPMGLLYLGLLALVVRRWTPIRQRIAALVLSPLITLPVLLAFTWNPLEGVLFGLGVPVVYGLIVTLPRSRGAG
jgi:hypothetical protein